MTDRQTLEADLERYRAVGDFAAEAETLLALAQLAHEDEAYGLAQGLCGQAWAIYEQIDDKCGMAKAILQLVENVRRFAWRDDLAADTTQIDVTRLYALAMSLYIEAGDQREQAQLYYEMVESHLYNPDTVQDYLRQAAALYEALNDLPHQAAMLMELFYWYVPDTPEWKDCVIQAQALYQASGDKKGELAALHTLYRYQFELQSPEAQAVISRSLELLRQLEDAHGEAALYLDIGQMYLARQSYEQARTALDTARLMFTQLEDFNKLSETRTSIGRLILETENYSGYLHYAEAILRDVRSLPQNRHHIFQQMCSVARKHQDFATARYWYQQAAAYFAGLNQPAEQAEQYWVWGRMEYEEANQKHMGLMLCQWAVTLHNHYHPDENRYSKKLRIMRREMHPKRHKTS